MLVCLFLVCFVLLRCSESGGYDPTERIYPWPLPQDRQPLFISLITSFSESFDSSGVVPGVNVALDIINNNDSNLLSGYSLHYILSDSKVGSCHTACFTPWQSDSCNSMNHRSTFLICSVRRAQRWMLSFTRSSLKLSTRS